MISSLSFKLFYTITTCPIKFQDARGLPLQFPNLFSAPYRITRDAACEY